MANELFTGRLNGLYAPRRRRRPHVVMRELWYS
jgi:hypothetical protein